MPRETKNTESNPEDAEVTIDTTSNRMEEVRPHSYWPGILDRRLMRNTNQGCVYLKNMVPYGFGGDYLWERLPRHNLTYAQYKEIHDELPQTSRFQGHT